MASKRNKIESEILRYRNEGNWAKVEESTRQLSKKYGASDGAVVLLESETELELYLQENPPRRENVARSRKDLQQLKLNLQDAMSLECKESSMFIVKEESCMLLCKLLYSQGHTTACLDMVKNIDLKHIGGNSAIPCYKLRLVAETYAFKGLSLEHSGHTAALTEENVQNSIVDCYELSTEFSLAYVSEYERLHGLGTEITLSYGMEVGFQRAPLLYIKNKDVLTGIKRLRHSLRNFETRGVAVKQTLSRDLATLLLRGVSEVTYESASTFQNDEGSKPTKSDGSPEKPHASSPSGGSSPPVILTLGSPIESFFTPEDCTQESILLLLITEAMVNSDPLLDLSPEYAEERSQLLHDSRTLYDLLAVALTKFHQYDLFMKSVEAALKYSYDEFHIWFQYALASLSAGRFDRAVRILMECCRIKPQYPLPYLLIAKVCFENLESIEMGLEYAGRALEAASAEKSDSQPQFVTNTDDLEDNSDYLASAHLAVGMGLCYQCLEGETRDNIAVLRQKALEHFTKAHDLDPYDYKPVLFMAIEMALDRRICEALEKVTLALELQPHDLNCLHLLILLKTAQKETSEPLTMLDAACQLYPENISLLMTRCRIQMDSGDHEKALVTCNTMMQIWKNLQEAHKNNTLNAENMIERMTSDGLSVTNHSIGNELDIDAGSFIANSAALSRVGRALSGVESSLGDAQPHAVGLSAGHPWMLQARIWMLMSEVYAMLERFDEAANCLKEASTLFPLSHEVLYTCGKLAMYKGELDEASTMFTNTLAIHPKHHKALLSWGQLLLDQGNLDFAKKLLKDAVKLSPMSHEVWKALGETLQAKEDFDGAADCLEAAINLEATAPILPFTTVSRDI